MIGVVAAVFRLDDARSLAEPAARVALAAPFGRTPLQVLRFYGEVLKPPIAVEAPRRAGAGPGDRAREFLTRHKRRPRRLGDHPDAVRQPYDAGDTRHRLRLGIVDPVRGRPFYRGAEHRAIQHPRHLDVDAVGCAAVDLARQLGAHHILAYEPELGRLLQILGLDRRRLGGNLGKGGDFACTTTLGSVVSSSTGTPQCLAALLRNTRRTCAPNVRSGRK